MAKKPTKKYTCWSCKEDNELRHVSKIALVDEGDVYICHRCAETAFSKPEAEESKMGRPPKYTDAEEMQKIVDAYFIKCETVVEDKSPMFPSMAGLAYELGMCTESLRNYGKDEDFFGTVKEARQRVEMAWEQRLLAPGSGPIFWLKNNAGWKDKTEQEIAGKGGVPIQTAMVINFIPVRRKDKDDN